MKVNKLFLGKGVWIREKAVNLQWFYMKMWKQSL